MKIKRQDLQKGKLYYIHRKIIPSDFLILWKHGPEFSNSDIKDIDDEIGRIRLNKQNIFCFLGCYPDPDPELDSTFWYRILISNGKIGYFVLCDEEIEGLNIKFYEAIKKSIKT